MYMYIMLFLEWIFLKMCVITVEPLNAGGPYWDILIIKVPLFQGVRI